METKTGEYDRPGAFNQKPTGSDDLSVSVFEKVWMSDIIILSHPISRD